MHSLAPYCFKVHDPRLPGDTSEKYHKLNNIRGLDLVDLIDEFADLFSTRYEMIEDDKIKKTFKFTHKRKSGRDVYGQTASGVYGIKSKVVDVNSGDTAYNKRPNDADVNELFFHFKVPYDSTVGVCVFHNLHGRGMKSVFLELFNEHFRKKTSGLILQMHPISYLKAVEELMKKSNVKELRLKRYYARDGMADVADRLSEHTAELIIKPKKKGEFFGNFWDFSKNSGHTGNNRELIEIMTENCAQVSAVVEFDGKKRVFSLTENSTPISSIEFDEDDVRIEDGVPELESLIDYSGRLLNDLSRDT